MIYLHSYETVLVLHTNTATQDDIIAYLLIGRPKQTVDGNYPTTKAIVITLFYFKHQSKRGKF